MAALPLSNTVTENRSISDEPKTSDTDSTNSVLENSEGATHHDLSTLRDRIPWQAFTVAVVEFAERWTYYGTTNLFNNYIRAPLPPGSLDGSVAQADRAFGVAGAPGKGQEKSFAIRTFNTFFVYITPFLGATRLYASSRRLFSSRYVPRPPCSRDFAMAVGAGTLEKYGKVNPEFSRFTPFIWDIETLATGEVVIVSPGLTIYVYFYVAINLGSTGAISASFLARDNGFWVAYLIPTCVFATVPIVLLGCSYKGGKIPGRITWDDEFVGEMHRTVEACKVFLFFPIYWLYFSQIDGNLGTVVSGMKLNGKLPKLNKVIWSSCASAGPPNDLINNLDPISIVIMVPIFERLIYPARRKVRINFNPIKRITAGFVVAGLAVVYSAVLEKYLYDRSPCNNHHPSACRSANGEPNAAPLNVWIVAGPYILVAISEIFACITSLYARFSFGSIRFGTVLASMLNFALTAVNVEQRFEWLFASFAITAVVFAGIFYWTFRDLDMRETELNLIGMGERDGFVGERSLDRLEKAA
ncbi:peptide/h+ symporter protein [Mycena olivaceomarginata]|nr:peptide/h+ symporter protein [Mycena olivaceomarginata]